MSAEWNHRPGIQQAIGQRRVYVHALLLETAADAGWKQPRKAAAAESESDYADRMATAFAILAAGSGNRQLTEIVVRIGERLHSVRRGEPEIVPTAIEVLTEIEVSMHTSATVRRDVIWRYHRQCAAHAAALIDFVAR